MLQLITISNRCHRFPGFVYRQARFSSDHKSIEIAVRPRKGSAAVCSRCHQPGPGYDELGQRRFEFILWTPDRLAAKPRFWTDETPEWFAGGTFEFSSDYRQLIHKTRWGNTVRINLADGSLSNK